MPVACTIADTAVISKTVTSPEPVDPAVEPESPVGGISDRPAAAVASPVGRLTKKIQCQLIA